MDAFISSLSETLINWGYLGMFLSAFLAGSVVPFSSELVLVGLVHLGLSPLGCVLAATAGNVGGGMTCYYMGHLGRLDWIERYFHVRREKVERMQAFLKGKGALMAFFAFLPIVGTAISIALGFMRANIPLTVSSMTVGKFIRYLVMVLLMQGVQSLI